MTRKAKGQQVAREEDLSAAKDIALIRMKQKQIVEGACKLFLKKGFHDTSTREIADVCGFSKGLLYHYIKTKDDIIFLTYSYLRNLWAKKFVAAGIDAIENPLQRMVAALGLTMDFMINNTPLHLFLETQRSHLSAEKKEEFLCQKDAITIRYWSDLLKQVEKDHPLACDIETGAKIIIQNNYFFVQNEVGRNKETVTKYKEAVIQFILRGLGLTPPS